jgi:DNA-binding ferritin-like protein (Dps family)
MIELNKIDEIANRLRQYGADKKPRYFNLKYINQAFAEPQLIAERISGEMEFRNRVNEAINTYKADKIIVEEFNQKAKSVKEPASVVEISVNNGYTITLPPNHYNQRKDEPKPNIAPVEKNNVNPLEMFGGLDGFKQEIRSEIAKEYQLLKEQDEKKKLIEENIRLKEDNKEFQEDNTKLYELNDELSEKIKELQKYIPDNLKIGNLSVTKVLGSILGTATETMVKNIVVKRPEKVKDIIGETAFEQLSGLVGDDDLDNELSVDNSQLQEVQPLSGIARKEEEQNPVVNAINQINSNLPTDQLAKVQLIYYHLLNDDESLDDSKLDELVSYIQDNNNLDNEPENE